MDPINVYDYEALARERLDPATWAYYSGGAGDEITLRANRAAFERLQLLPRMLSGVQTADLRTTVLGAEVRMPILVAPTSRQGLACPEGECATARAAGAVGTLMVAATEATRALEEIAAVATGPLWFQLYVYRDRSLAERLVRRAEESGYRAIVLTVDVPRWSGIERSRRDEFALPAGMRLANLDPDLDLDGEMEGAALAWDDLAWLRAQTSLPLVLKGILTPEDVRLATEHGVAGIVVSNHGGRALDTVPPTIEALPGIVAAVAGRCEVYLDGGIRRGTDALKALALGARAVLVGRPVLWGLAADGEAGARHVLELLRDELEIAMALVGRPTLASLDATLLTRGW